MGCRWAQEPTTSWIKFLGILGVVFDFRVSSSVVSEVSAGLTTVVSLLGLSCIGKLHGTLLHNLEKGKGSRHRDIKRTRLHWQPRSSVEGKKTRITPPKTASCSSQEPKKNLGEGPGRKSPTPTPPPPWKGPQGRLQSYRCGKWTLPTVLVELH